LRRQRRRPAISPLKRFHGRGKFPDHLILVDLIIPKDSVKIRLLIIQNLQKQVLDFHIVIRLRHTQVGSFFESFTAGQVEFIYEGFEIKIHAITPIPSSVPDVTTSVLHRSWGNGRSM